MKVLYISHGANLDGGAEKVLKGILEGLNRDLYQPVVVLPQKGTFSEWLDQQKIRYYFVSEAWMVFMNAWRIILIINAFLNIGAVRKIRRIIREERIEVVYTNSIVIFSGGIAAKLEGIAHIWHLHEIVFSNPSLGFGFGPRVLQSIITTLADRIIAVSNAVAQDLHIENIGEKSLIVPNGLPPSAWERPDPVKIESIRQELGIQPRAKILIFLGTLGAYKKPEKAIETLGRIRRDDVYLLMVGGLSKELMVNRNIEHLIIKYQLKDRVIFTGFRKDATHILALADVSIVPSCNEAWGLATVEAMAAGLPVVAGDGGSNRDFIVNFESGFLIPNGDPVLMAECIENLFNDANLTLKIGTTARMTSQQFSIDVHLRKIASILDDTACIKTKPVNLTTLSKSMF